MLVGGMGHELTCGKCEFTEVVDEDWRAYDRAKRHEKEFPTHYVVISRLE